MTTVRWSISGYERYRDYIASAIKEMYRENGGFVLDGNVLVAEHAYHNKAEVRSVLETAKRMYLSDHVSEDFFRELFDQLGEDGKKASGEKSESGSYEINWTGIISTLIVEAGKSCKHFASDVFYDLLRIEEQLKQGEVVDLLLENTEAGAPKACGVVLRTGSTYLAKAVILATGTFLGGKVFIGDSVYESGPNGLAPSTELARKLRDHGLPMRRFKTGTPARALAQSLDYDKMLPQDGDPEVVPFSFMNEALERDQISCWLTYTNERTHEIIRNNFHRSALFGGQIEGIGPRYCPSIEDKVNRFADKERHQLFIEPEGLETEEMYIQGMSSSLPEDVQWEFYHSIAGLENIEITKPAYAIEYDCVDPLSLKPSLESKIIKNLFCAGQFNGSSGYEEAAAQGIMAGINANMLINGKNPLVLGRNEAYIGVLIDDLVTKGTNEPYRIMTSRAEYRLLLRQDNADDRLTKRSYELGLASEERYQLFLKKKKEVEDERRRLEETMVKPALANPFLLSLGSTEISGSVALSELLKRPEVSYDNLAEIDENRPLLSRHARAQIAVEIKYSGYIEKQREQVERFRKLENRLLPDDLDYLNMKGLRIEAAQKLDAQRPESIG